jgi:hypothetical protein
MLDEFQRRNYSQNIVNTYLHAVQRFRKLCIRIQGSQVVATPRSDDPECCFDRTQYFRNRSRRLLHASAEAVTKGRTIAHESARPQRQTAESSEVCEHSFGKRPRSQYADRIPVKRDVYH